MNPIHMDRLEGIRLWLRWIFLALLFGLAPTAWSVYSPKVEIGLSWLSNQVQTDGSLTTESASIATPLQVRSEVAHTLQQLSGLNSAALVNALLADPGNSTEYLARKLAAVNPNELVAADLSSVLLSSQNADGGFGGTYGYASNPLDTAWALLAQKSSDLTITAIPTALDYLQSAIQADGSYTANGQSNVYVTAIVLSALHAYASQYALTATINQTVAYLSAQQQPDGSWDGEPFVSALVYRAVHDFVAQQPMATEVSDYLLAAQGSDGSWGGDPYVTALALSALALTAESPSNPSLSILRGHVVDAQTGLPLSGVAVTLTGGSSSSQVTTNGGVFEFRDLTPGQYQVQLSLTDYVSITVTTAILAGATQNVGELRMSKSATALTGTVQGRVTDSATGQPLSGVTVSVGATTATTGANGQYQINNLSPGAITLTASLSRYSTVSGAGTLVAGGVIVFSPALTPQTATQPTEATVMGVVTSGVTGQPLAGVRVSVSGSNALDATTDSSGAFTLAGLNEGAATITASLAGYDTVIASTFVYQNSTVVFSPKMYPSATTPPGANTAGVTGVVLDAGTHQPLANVTIQASIGGVNQTFQSGADGRFSLSGMSEASVDLGFILEGYRKSTINVALMPLVEVDIGQVRLRQSKAAVLLPDLTAKAVARQGSVTNPQTLAVTGHITATIANVGTAGALTGFSVLAFHDANLNSVYDPKVDAVLGQTALSSGLLPDTEAQIQIQVNGFLPFRDAPIHVWVDSSQSIAESREDNNVGSTAMSIAVNPDIATFKPVLKWAWKDGISIATPIVGPLVDTDGNGKINQDDTPTVIVVKALGIDFSPGILTALSGNDGRVLWSLDDVNAYTGSETTPALADIDGDGKPEVVAYTHNGGAMAVNNDGSIKWKSDYPPVPSSGYNCGAPSVADLDGDGKAEIIYRNYVLNADGTLRFVFQTGSGLDVYHAVVTAVADLDLDGKPELITGSTAVHADGSLYWQNTSLYDGALAVANLGGDDHPEIALVTDGRAYLVGHDGSLIWGPTYIGHTNGGAPTVADMDGDGALDIGVAGFSFYTVLNADGSIKWQTPISDASGMTGSTVFDFDGNGKAEVVYFDGQTLYVFDGTNGNVVFSTPNSSLTATEYPVVTDVDNDGHADIVVPQQSSEGGIRVFQDENNSWVNTRRIWNEYHYHITNIDDDGSVPRVEQNSWQVHNTYRLNARPGISATAVPDITASLLRVEDHGGTQPSMFTVRIGNGGSEPIAAGVPVAFYSGRVGGTLLGRVITTQTLKLGEYQDVSLSYAGSLSGMSRMLAVADDDSGGKHTVNDFDRGNNEVELPLAAMPGSFAIAITTDQPNYGANATALFTTTVVNRGSFGGSVQVQLSLEADDGSLVETLSPLPPLAIGSASNVTTTVTWNTGSVRSGSYLVRASLLNADGTMYATATARFDIVAGDTLLMTSLWTDKQAYASSDLIRITGRVTNVSANQALNDLTLEERLTDPDGTIVDLGRRKLPQLPPGALNTQTYSHTLSQAPAGVYVVTQTVADASGALLDSRQTTFTVLPSTVTGTGLSGTIRLNPHEVSVGEMVSIRFSAVNQGNAGYTGLPLTVRIVNPASGTVLAEYPAHIDLAVGNTYVGGQSWTAEGHVGDILLVVLSALVGNQSLTLAQDTMTIVKPSIDLLIEQSVATHARILALASCEDDSRDGLRDAHKESGHGYFSHRADPHHGSKGFCHDDSGDTSPGHHCDRTRAEAMTRLLDGLDVSYTIVTSVADFQAAFRSGAYNVYWLSGKQTKLANDFAAELREAIYRGDSLLIDGAHDARNQTLDEATGLSYQGKQGQSNLTASLMGAWYAQASLATVGRADTLTLAGGTLQATLMAKNTAIPGMVSYTYGTGQSLTFAFDLIASAAQEPGWGAALGTGLEHMTPAPVDVLTGGGYLPIQTRLHNRGIASEVRVTSQLPTGARYWGSAPAATLDPSGAPTVRWQFLLAAMGAQNLELGLFAPLSSGNYRLVTEVETLNTGTATLYGTPLEHPFSVYALAERLPETLTQIQALPVTSFKDRQRRNQAADDLNRAQNELRQGHNAEAIDSLMGAIERLRDISTADASAARRAVDLILQETEVRWYQNANP